MFGVMTSEELATRRHGELIGIARKTYDGMSDLTKRFELHVKDDDHEHETSRATSDAQRARLDVLENKAEQSGAHDITELQQRLTEEKRRRDSERAKSFAAEQRWKGRAWAIFAALLMSAVSAGAGAYLGR